MVQIRQSGTTIRLSFEKLEAIDVSFNWSSTVRQCQPIKHLKLLPVYIFILSYLAVIRGNLLNGLKV